MRWVFIGSLVAGGLLGLWYRRLEIGREGHLRKPFVSHRARVLAVALIGFAVAALTVIGFVILGPIE
jgi:hypothetical protein